MSRARPWRAAAYVPLGASRYYVGGAAAQTREGLNRFVTSREAEGLVVDVWEVLPHPQIAEAAEASAIR